jgi:lipoprotein-releasing system permease protein
VVQGAMAGVIGTLVGLLFGLAIAFNIDAGAGLERLLNASFCQGHLPDQPHAERPAVQRHHADRGDCADLAFLALYPSWRASRVNQQVFDMNESCVAGHRSDQTFCDTVA